MNFIDKLIVSDNENEIIMLILSVLALMFIFVGFKDLKRVAGYKYLLSSFLFFFGASVFTIVESYMWCSVFNFLEHISYLISLILLFYWYHLYTARENR